MCGARTRRGVYFIGRGRRLRERGVQMGEMSIGARSHGSRIGLPWMTHFIFTRLSVFLATVCTCHMSDCVECV